MKIPKFRRNFVKKRRKIDQKKGQKSTKKRPKIDQKTTKNGQIWGCEKFGFSSAKSPQKKDPFFPGRSDVNIIHVQCTGID